MVSIVVGRRAAAGAGFRAPMLRITVFAPRASGIVMTAILRCGVPAGAAGGRAAMLTGGRIAPRSITHAVAGIIIIRCTTVTARTGAPVLTGRILLPASITVTMAAGIDRLTLALTAGARIASVTIAGAGSRLLTLQHPRMAAAVRAGAGTVSASAVALVGVCSKILNVVAGITFVVICVAA